MRCPYCPAQFRSPGSLRLHVACNDCGAVPAGTCVPFTASEARDISEDEWRLFVTAAARQLGWEVAHVSRALTGQRVRTPTTKGFPDLWILRPGQLVVLELKRVGGRRTPEQEAWIEALDAVPGVAALFAEPTMWCTIQQLLTGVTLPDEL